VANTAILVVDFGAPLASAAFVDQRAVLDRSFAYSPEPGCDASRDAFVAELDAAIRRIIARTKRPSTRVAVVVHGKDRSDHWRDDKWSLASLRSLPSPMLVAADVAEAVGMHADSDLGRIDGVSVHVGIGRAIGVVAGQGDGSTPRSILHDVVDPYGPMCSCGGRGCLAAYISDRALQRGRRLMGIDHAKFDHIAAGDLAEHLAWRVRNDACLLSAHVLNGVTRAIHTVLGRQHGAVTRVVMHGGPLASEYVGKRLQHLGHTQPIRAPRSASARLVGAARLVISR